MPTRAQANNAANNIDVTITSGQTDSAEIDLTRKTIVGIHIPAEFDGTVLGFKVAKVLGGTYNAMQDGAGNAYSKTVALSTYIPISPADFVGINALKLSATTTQTTSDTVLTIVVHAV